MYKQPTSDQQSRPPINWSSLIQLIFSVLAAILLLGAAVFVALTNATQHIFQTSASIDLTQSYMVAASLAFAGILVLPSAWYAWKHIAYPEAEPVQRPEPRSFGLILTIVVLVLVAGALWLGNWASQNERVSWILLPPLNIIATGLPALWLVYIGTRGLNPGASRRKWGVFASGLVLGPAIILILELITLVGMGILAILWAVLDPSLSSQLNGLVLRVQNANGNPEAILNILLPFILNPGMLFLVFAFMCVLVPMIEEALKPIGVWFLANQKITPAQGFGYGVLSGAGFGIFENLGNTSNGGAGWALLASARISTLLLHSFTAGLLGWALVSAWSQRRYLRLGLSYVVAVLVHGLWNGMAILSLVTSLPSLTTVYIPTSLLRIGELTSIGIIALGALVLVFYIGFHAVLLRSMPQMNPASSGESRGPVPSDNPPLPPAVDELSQSSIDNSNSVPIQPGDTPDLPESAQQNLREEANPPTKDNTP